MNTVFIPIRSSCLLSLIISFPALAPQNIVERTMIKSVKSPFTVKLSIGRTPTKIVNKVALATTQITNAISVTFNPIFYSLLLIILLFFVDQAF